MPDPNTLNRRPAALPAPVTAPADYAALARATKSAPNPVNAVAPEALAS